MSKRPVAIVLGGTAPHIALIENLKRRGYYTVLVDYYENPPAAEFADEHIRESTLDQEKVLEIARRLDAGLVISACIDHANATASYVSEKMFLPSLYGYEIALDVTRKDRMKQILVGNGISTAPYIVVDAVEHVTDRDLRYPLVVKPVDNWGSRGVSIVEDSVELVAQVASALEASPSKQVIIEEFVEGFEISVDCFVVDGFCHVLQMRRRCKVIGEDRIDFVCIGSISPPGLPDGMKVIIEQIAQKTVDAFKLNTTPLLLQLIINKGRIAMVEVAARLGGSTHFQNIANSTGVDILSLTIDAVLQKIPMIEITRRVPFNASSIIYAREGIVDRIEGPEVLLSTGIIQSFVVFKSSGVKIGPGLSAANRVCGHIITAESENELYKRIKIANDTIKVVDASGSDIMRRDLCIQPDRI